MNGLTNIATADGVAAAARLAADARPTSESDPSEDATSGISEEFFSGPSSSRLYGMAKRREQKRL